MAQSPKTPLQGPRSPPPARDSPPPPKGTAGPASGALPDVREPVRRWVESFRRSDRFFKMRVGIVGSWAVISLVTLWAACPSSGPSNSLGADVQVLRDSLVGGQQLLVRNESTESWTEVVLTLDEDWRRQHKTVRPHDQLVLSMSDFKREGRAAPRDFKPRRLTLECDQGRAAFDLR
ncbi:MAG TPA: hypothetical protein VFI16_04985 [Anaeromyxobacteraceae bacterium]|nr:hypothetical protein [Anaeromyxobacteraceae bacterium]